MHQTCCVFEARLEIVLPVSQDADVFVRRCHPPWFSRCGPGALCDWQQDSPHLESQGSGSWPSWGPVLPHQEGSQHPQAPGEEQEGVNSFHCLLSLNSSYCIIPFIFSFFLMFSQNTLFFVHYSYSLFFLLKWDDCIWKYHKMPGAKCAHMHSLCCLLPSSNSWFVCLCTTNAVLSGVHQSHAGSVLANPSPGFMLRHSHICTLHLGGHLFDLASLPVEVEHNRQSFSTLWSNYSQGRVKNEMHRKVGGAAG